MLSSRYRRVMCIGDSITHGTAGRPPLGNGVHRNWVEILTARMNDSAERSPGGGYRGLWRTDEWVFSGAWSRTDRAAPYDVAPFAQGWISSGREPDLLTWIRPPTVEVAAFDIYWIHVPELGNWQYRIDGGEWTSVPTVREPPNSRLQRLRVSEPINDRFEIRGHDGRSACVATVAGIGIYATASPPATGTIVHNVGHNFESLLWFCRPSAGDPLALVDDLRPDLVTILFSNDASFNVPAKFETALRTLVARVQPYADVLMVNPYEQRPSRRVGDAVTNAGEAVVISATASFVATDARSGVSGSNIAEGSTIIAVESAELARLSKVATGSGSCGQLTIDGRDASAQAQHRAIARAVAADTDCAFVDLYSAWAELAGPGWEAANAFGLMHDRLHPSQRGHDDIATRVHAAIEKLATSTTRARSDRPAT